VQTARFRIPLRWYTAFSASEQYIQTAENSSHLTPVQECNKSQDYRFVADTCIFLPALLVEAVPLECRQSTALTTCIDNGKAVDISAHGVPTFSTLRSRKQRNRGSGPDRSQQFLFLQNLQTSFRAHCTSTLSGSQKVKLGRYIYPCTGLDRPPTASGGWGFQDFRTVCTWRWQGCLPFIPAAFIHQGRSLVLSSVRGSVDPRATVRPKGCNQ
jgi:hypothetical protein